LCSVKESNRKKKKRWKSFSSKNNSIQDSEGNEDNGYPVLDPNKTKINDTKELSNTHRNTLKEEIPQEITENFMEKIYNALNQMYKIHSRNFKTPKIKNTRRQKQINELIVALNKYQSERENTIER
jgi:predicted house-cleaning noncanonical NTP pyrophosphatase (MazG superfamily)